MMQRRAGFLWLVLMVSLVSVGLTLGGVLPSASAGQPIVLSIIDNGGDYASTGVIIENYQKANPDKVKEVKLQRGPAPETPAKIKAQQDAGRADINLILTRQDAGSVLAANKQLIELFPKYDKMFPKDELNDGRGESTSRSGGRRAHAGGGERRRPGVYLQPEEGAEAAVAELKRAREDTQAGLITMFNTVLNDDLIKLVLERVYRDAKRPDRAKLTDTYKEDDIPVEYR